MKKFVDFIDTDYSLYVTEKLRTFTSNADLGFRTSGSKAEKEAADFILGEYKKLGLSNCRKEEVTVDTFEFEKADLEFVDASGNKCLVKLSAYQTSCNAESEKIEIVYVKRGTEFDYENVDAKGKYVLIDIDMMSDWWINWPLCQAREKGVKGIIAVNVSGYCSYADDCIGTQDLYGPADVPAFSISVADANRIKAVMKENSGIASAILTAKSTVKNDGSSYCVIGEIPGKIDEVVYLIGHYDAYFKAFDDNTAGIGCILGIVNAFMKSGYEPRRTLRVICHGAEEWGLENSKYDWARGAWALTQKHPEWSDNGFALVNIDGNTINSTASMVQIRTCFEMAPFIVERGETIEGRAHDIETNTPIWTWTESIMYSLLGIPTMETFYKDVNFWGSYHSNYDLKEVNSYTDEEYKSSHIIYGSYLQMFDDIKVRPLDFTLSLEKLKESITDLKADNKEAFAEAIDCAIKAAKTLKAYDTLALDEAQTLSFNKKISALFMHMIRNLYGINWADEFDFAHVRYMTNVNALSEAISKLEAGESFSAVKSDLARVDLTNYMYWFDKATCEYLRQQVIGENVRETWATGLVETECDLWDVVRNLMRKEEKGVKDYSEEIAVLKQKLEMQKKLLNDKNEKVIEALAKATHMMNAIGKQ